ncbi:MAG: ornithine cyclodeaminase family protein [Thermodesulfobacteriota bacterium]
MIFLSASEINKAVSRAEVNLAMEEAMLVFEKGDFIMPDRMHIHRGMDTFLLMPCMGKSVIATKLVSIFPGNRSMGLPSLTGLIILNSATTGEPIALMNGAEVTALRTGAVGSVGVKYLALPETDSIGLIGTGVQGRSLIFSSLAQREFRRVTLFDSDPAKASALCEELRITHKQLSCKVVTTPEECVVGSGVVITATTAPSPVLPDDPELLKGKCFVGVGAFRPDMREFPDSLLELADQIYVDTPFAAEECGDLIDPIKKGIIKKEHIFTLGKLVDKSVSLTVSKTRVYKTTGMALFDLTAAELVFNNATQAGMGVTLTL